MVNMLLEKPKVDNDEELEETYLDSIYAKLVEFTNKIKEFESKLEKVLS